MHFADRLLAAIEAKDAPVCVGLDPVVNRIPRSILQTHGLPSSLDLKNGSSASATFRAACAAAIEEFCGDVMEVVVPLVPAVKINIAFFEKYGVEGLAAYERLVAAGRRLGLVVIGDVKRADIGNTSAQYADAHLEDTSAGPGPDAITINPYFGWDSVSPFIDAAHRKESGLFILVQTSNPSAAEVQDLRLEGGGTVCHAVARLVERWACQEGMVGKGGFSAIGAVVSPRDVESTQLVRSLMPHCIFLVPGFGVQGRTADEVRHCFRTDGRGAIIAASRSVLFAYEENRKSSGDGSDWRPSVVDACRALISQVRAVIATS